VHRGDQAGVRPSGEDGARRRRSTLTVVAYAVFLVLPTAVLAYTYLGNLTGALDATLRTAFVPFSAVSDTTWLVTALAVVVLLGFLVGANAFVARSAYAGFAAFFLTAVVLGAVLFGLAPSALDILNANGFLPTGLSYDSAVFGTTLYLFFFTVFVNIHHYFIDNVIWKRDNPFVRRHLVS
jgi:magnesium-transporting ATPase (P-type)